MKAMSSARPEIRYVFNYEGSCAKVLAAVAYLSAQCDPDPAGVRPVPEMEGE
jgi:hypothetical protein